MFGDPVLLPVGPSGARPASHWGAGVTPGTPVLSCPLGTGGERARPEGAVVTARVPLRLATQAPDLGTCTLTALQRGARQGIAVPEKGRCTHPSFSGSPAGQQLSHGPPIPDCQVAPVGTRGALARIPDTMIAATTSWHSRTGIIVPILWSERSWRLARVSKPEFQVSQVLKVILGTTELCQSNTQGWAGSDVPEGLGFRTSPPGSRWPAQQCTEASARVLIPCLQPLERVRQIP